MKKDPILQPYVYCDHLVPGYWQYLLPDEILDYTLPKERRATCDSCPMAKFDNYDSTYRCCSYHPTVPNFLMGFASHDPKNLKTLQKLRKRGLLVPEGFQRSPLQWVDYLADLSDDNFGGANRVKCSLLDEKTGMCGIYAFRNAVCSTFFCHNDHGKNGEKFWQCLEEMITHAENAICQWALEQLGFNMENYCKTLDKLSKKIDKLFNPETKGWKEKYLKKIWKHYYGREIELYQQCAKLISENRDRLWEIACGRPLYEAEKFEKATTKIVPKKYRDEIDPEDLDDDAESIDMKELHRDLQKSYQKLWGLPDNLALSQRVKIRKNPKDDKESQAFGDRPFVVEYLYRKGGKSVDWREFVSAPEAEALKQFKGRKSIRKSLFSRKYMKKFSSPEKFLAEWHGKKVLQHSKPR